jgi:hypothetical protein
MRDSGQDVLRRNAYRGRRTPGEAQNFGPMNIAIFG